MSYSRSNHRSEPPPLTTGSSSRATATTTAILSESTATSAIRTRVNAAPRTPSHRKRALKPISAKQLDKIQRNLDAAERTARTRVSSSSSPSEAALGGSGGAYTIPEEAAVDGEADAAAAAAMAAHQRVLGGEGNRIEAQEELLTREIREEMYIKRPSAHTLIRGLVSGNGAAGGSSSSGSFPPAAGASAAGMFRSRTAASQGGGAGRDQANDSFHHEASFVLNPLNRRTTAPSPRTSQAARMKGAAGPGGKGKEKERASSGASPAQDGNERFSLRDLPKDIQEGLIMEDLLYALQGIEGEYVTFADAYDVNVTADQLRGPTWVVDPDLDLSLKDMVERILPLATYAMSIFTFIELESNLTFGTVVHALCAAIRNLLKEYEILLVQLEHQFDTSSSFTLQKMWFYLHPTLRTLSLVHSLTSSIAVISHADVLEDDEDEDEDEDDEDGSEAGGRAGSNASMERQRRALLGLDDPVDPGDAIEGGIVKGGEVLSMLWDRVTRMSGDPSAHALYLNLFQSASQPYKATLLRWISTGYLSDPYEEFIVMEDSRVTQVSLEQDPTDEYWERRYTLRDETILAARETLRQQGLLDFDENEMDDEDEHGPRDPAAAGAAGIGAEGERGIITGGAKVPAFLEPWKHKILLAGKYWNVIRECGAEVAQVTDFADGHDSAVLNEASFLKRIETAYERANTTLLKMLINEQMIKQRLRSVKHYFVMEHADFFSSFYEQSIRDLRRPFVPGRVGSTPMRLSQQLGMVLGSSTTVGANDPYKEDLRVECNNEKVYSQLMRIAETKGGIESARALAKQQEKDKATAKDLKVVDVMQFDLSVKFPVSLVLSKKNILRWQFLQRVLLHLKVLEKELAEIWGEHQEPMWKKPRRGHPALENWKGRIFKLRHSMIFVIQHVLGFMTNEVIEPGWNDLEEKMANAKTVDQFMRDHFDFLNVARKQAMLTDFKYLSFHTRMTSVVEYFLQTRVHFRDQLQQAVVDWEASPASSTPSMDPKVLDFLEKVEEAWKKQSKNFRDCVILVSTTENPAATLLAHKLQAATLF